MVRAGKVVFALTTSFARVPAPGEHVLLRLSDAQSAQLGAEFGVGKSRNWLPAIVRDTILRPKDQWRVPNPWSPTETMGDHIADLFVEAISTDGWQAQAVRWASGGD